MVFIWFHADLLSSSVDSGEICKSGFSGESGLTILIGLAKDVESGGSVVAMLFAVVPATEPFVLNVDE